MDRRAWASQEVVDVIFRSPYPDVDVPDLPLTPFVLQRARDLGSTPALVEGATGRSITFEELDGAVRAAAAGLADRGLRKGDAFGIFCPNVPEFAVAFHAVSLAGGTITTINSLYTAEEVAFQLVDSGARFLLTVPPFMDRALPAAEKAGIEEVFVLGEAEGVTPFANVLAAGTGKPVPQLDLDPARDLVTLPYSSGTTGLPKGVMLSHRNLVANLCQILPLHHVGEGERVIAVLPFFHIYGLVVVMNLALHRGATLVTMPKFDLEPFLQILQDQAITRAYLVPPIVLALAKHPAVDRFDLSALRTIMSGAAPLDANLAEACAERLGCAVFQGYGLTETSPVTHLTPDEPGKGKPGFIGVPLPSTECRVVDVIRGGDLGPNADGEIWVRGPQVMQGYLNNPEATARTVDADGWLHTGDIGRADEGGYFRITDRLKELIKYKGYQVPPAELEAVLVSHPAVADAAVIPSPDPEAGEVPKAFVVLRGEATPGELMDYVAERVAPHMKVRRLEFVQEIPKSASGKILRRVLVERERASAG